MKRNLLKTTSLLLLLLVISTSLFFIIYPNYSSLKIQLSQFNSNQISRNTTLNIFSKISRPSIVEGSYEQDSEGSLEHISKEILEEYEKKNKIFKVEEKKTKLTIESAQIEGKVVDGKDANAMERGFWYYPISPPPGEQGNTVIIGHRFLNIPPSKDTFFNLDEVRIGDQIVVQQEGAEYTYTVINKKVVEKDNTTVLENTRDYRITLITCTPLWTDEKRLIIVGKMDKVYGII